MINNKLLKEFFELLYDQKAFERFNKLLGCHRKFIYATFNVLDKLNFELVFCDLSTSVKINPSDSFLNIHVKRIYLINIL